MAQDTTVSELDFKYWLDKATEWGQATTLESQKDVCCHLPQLQEFLQQIYETLKHMNSVVAIQQFPLIGQLLGRLCWNPFVIGYDESQKILMWCLCCLYSSEPQNPVELKANSWIRSLLCHLLSSSKWESNEAGTNTFISALGYTSADYYSHLVKNMVSSLVTELRENQFNGLNIQGRVSASRLNEISLFCVPLMTLPDVTPLLETLLLCHGGASQEVLSSEFLEAVNEAFLKKKISISETAIFSLWLRHLPSLEKATFYLLDQLVSTQMTSLEEVACVIKDSLLPQAATHPAIFIIVDEIFKSALLETDGAPEVMTVIQVFTQLFVQSHQNENKQHKFPVKAYFPRCHQPLVIALLQRPSAMHCSQHLKYISEMLKALVEDESNRSFADLFEIWFLIARFGEWLDVAAEQLVKASAEPDALLWLLAFYYSPQNENQQRTRTMVEAEGIYNQLTMLFNCTALSVKDLQDAVHKADIQQSSIQHLTTHLLTNFLLFSSGGHMIAWEYISHMSGTRDASREVCSLLLRAAHRAHRGGRDGDQQAARLANDLLPKVTSTL
ncbi:FANCC protein, partial [Crypturellus undulatus]|nr:FANCC protein [Crypturellus undulatus]